MKFKIILKHLEIFEKHINKILRQFSMDHQWILWISLILSIIVVIPMACVRTLRV